MAKLPHLTAREVAAVLAPRYLRPILGRVAVAT
jgi:hypothetical protein